MLLHAEAATQHTVKSGESLWSIAQQHNTTVNDIKQSNNLSNNFVFPGQVLSVGGNNTNSSQYSGQNSSATSHTVQAGESLNLIANQYGVSVNDLMRANNLNGYLIMPNQTLNIPSGPVNVLGMYLIVVLKPANQ